jgi:ketosteroid isomerase-like protein
MPPGRTSPNVSAVFDAYELARKAKHEELRERIVDDAVWLPAKEASWNPCRNADQIVQTMLWRAGMNRMRPSEPLDLGDRVLVKVRGRHLTKLGARGLFPTLFQIIAFRNGQIVSIHDYVKRADAYAAAGLRA